MCPGYTATKIERCLKKDRAERPDTVAEIATALAEFATPASHDSLDRLTRSSRTTQPGSDSSPRISLQWDQLAMAGTLKSWSHLGVTSKRHRPIIMAMIGILIVGIGALLRVVCPSWNRRRSPRPQPCP
jgi:hypothetical protein